MLFGKRETGKADEVMQVTVAFNHFGQGLVQRMPRVRWGFAHVVNNDYTHWLLYAIGGSSHPTILKPGKPFYCSLRSLFQRGMYIYIYIRLDTTVVKIRKKKVDANMQSFIRV